MKTTGLHLVCMAGIFFLSRAPALAVWRAPGESMASVSGHGTLVETLSGRSPSSPADPKFVAGRGNKQAWRVTDEALIHDLPESFDPSRGSVSFWFRPQGDCRDDVYRRFFSIEGAGRGQVYVLKSGRGGANGLFMCVIDEEGRWHAAHAPPGSGYEWEGGRWHHIAASWDAGAGMLQLFFDGRRVAKRRLSPFRLGAMGSRFAVGAHFDGSQSCGGDLADFHLFAGVATAEPLARALNHAAPGSEPWNAIDGDRGDGSAWTGLGAPNWLEIVMPEPIKLARVILHPGIQAYAGFPSTDGAPAVFTVQGYHNGSWRPLSESIEVPPVAQRPHGAVRVDLSPSLVDRFRIHITDLHDRGFRVDSPSVAVVPPAERAVRIREIEWFDASETAAMEQRARLLGREMRTGLENWQKLILAAEEHPLGIALAHYHGDMLEELAANAAALLPEDLAGWEELHGRWSSIEQWLAPWKELVAAAGNGENLSSPMEEAAWPAPGPEAGRLRFEVDPGQGGREFYPASVPLDLRILEAWWRTEIDPYTIQVIEVGPNGRPVRINAELEGFDRYLCPARFERLTPARGHLQWTMRDRNSTRFVARFLPRPESPPDLGGVTLGNGDFFYYNQARTSHLPWNIWSADIIDWDGDGKQDILAGRWTDFVHLWRNIGTREEPFFHEREHFLVRDVLDEPLHANPGHHGLAFSVAHAVDYMGDGLTDLFVDRYYGNRPRFYRRLNSPGFPVMDTVRIPIGLEYGKRAFGDLNDDGIADAVIVIAGSDADRLVFQAGLGLDANGTPRFGTPTDLNIRVSRSPAGGSGSRRLAPFLADVTGNGLLDLTIVSPPHVYLFENRGTPREPRFMEAARLQKHDHDLDIGLYYPSARWHDYNNNGTLDLIKSTGVQVYLNDAERGGVNLRTPIVPPLRGQQRIERSNLRAIAMVDWDKNGLPDHAIPHAQGPDILLSRRNPDGTFQTAERIEVNPERRDWYGCPDPAEYASLYGMLQLVDWTGNGHYDVFIHNEHTWRFGYLSYYENLGDGVFGPEVKLRPGGRDDHVMFEPGASGLGARIDEKTFLDYLSYPTAGRFDPSAGRVHFWVRPLWEGETGRPHYFFYNAPAPTARGVAVEDLRRYYTGLLPDLEIPPPFAIYRTSRGALRLQAGESHVESEPLAWHGGGAYRVEASWGGDGLELLVDGTIVAHCREPVAPVPTGQRMHIGSKAWMGIQREREYPGRWDAHPTDFSFPATAVLDDFEVYGAKGDLLFALRFEGHADSEQGDTGKRLRLGYRCTPGFGDLTGNGLPDMVMMLSDGRRGRGREPEHRTWGEGKLYLFPNVGAREQPALGEPMLLRHADGEPFHCNTRTQITLVDWNKNGLLDIILSTEGHGSARPYRGVVFFQNTGTPFQPVYSAGQPMDRLNEQLHAHHEVKLVAVDLTGNGREDLVTSTDPGTRIFFRSYLEEEPVRVLLNLP